MRLQTNSPAAHRNDAPQGSEQKKHAPVPRRVGGERGRVQCGIFVARVRRGGILPAYDTIFCALRGVPAASAAPRNLTRTLRHTPRIRPCTSPAASAARRLQSSADFIRRLPFPKAKLPFAKTERSFSKAGFRSQSGAAFCQSSTARLSKRRGTARPSKQRAPRPATLYKPYGIRRAYSIRSGNSYSSSSYGSLP